MGIRFEKFEPTEFVMAIKNGNVTKKGIGLSVIYNTQTTSIVIMPTTAIDTSFTFNDIMTTDFQSINVQGDISFVISDFDKAYKRVDFSFKNSRALYNDVIQEAKQNMAKNILNRTKVCITQFISTKNVKEAIVSGDALASTIKTSLLQDTILKELGLSLISVSVLGISAQPDTRKALEAATREEILKQQDDAVYKRRNAAIEQERIVKENELNTEIKIAEKEKERREKEMETKRMLQEKQAELDAQKLDNNIKLEEENRKLVDLITENDKKKADAKAYEQEVQLKLFANMNPEIIKALTVCGMDSKALIAKAFAEIGENADKIGVLNMSPDLLETLTK